jgi:NAD(P)-dependent dehydrogenase (short-subunit alcohol dehydrogenase family)
MENQINILESIRGRVSIITGSGRGIGAAIAKKLALSGAHIVINDINPESAEATAQEIRALGRQVIVSGHDISNPKSAQELADQAKASFGRIDILVNNAGITRDSLLHKLSEEKWDEVIRVNLKGPFNIGQACAREMMAQNYGKIVNLASVASQGNIGQTNYSASKAGVLGMTYTWALELAKYQINVNAIAPGFIDSILTQQIPSGIKQKFIERIPLKRMGSPEEIANLTAFLVSDSAAYLTGQCITMDGGLTTGA